MEKQEKSVEELRAELMATGKVPEIIDAAPDNPPEIREDAAAWDKIGTDTINQYMTYPVILDKGGAFKNHTERRVWRTQLPIGKYKGERYIPDVRDVYENNSIRGNPIGAALTAADMIIHPMVGTEQGDKLKEERDALLAEYEEGWNITEGRSKKELTLEEKIAFVEEKLKPFLRRIREVAAEK